MANITFCDTSKTGVWMFICALRLHGNKEPDSLEVQVSKPILPPSPATPHYEGIWQLPKDIDHMNTVL